MIAGKRKLPIGIDNFEKMIFYYVDKTGLISELLSNWGQVNLFTRPRRFGKSLNMSMLEQFFSIEGEKGLFDGLQISNDTELCRVETEDSEIGMIIELKYAGDGNLERACKKALEQIEETKYEETLLENGAVKILKYGIACYMKHCKVMCLGGVHGDS